MGPMSRAARTTSGYGEAQARSKVDAEMRCIEKEIQKAVMEALQTL